ncbi:GNAT family N-acetyltransferase [Sinorhizobium meliloti]|nr:GNAT family N-acetyltransferase [Sinorhizobium meliloti]
MPQDGFRDVIILETERLRLRAWRRPTANSLPRSTTIHGHEFFPFRRTRAEADAFSTATTATSSKRLRLFALRENDAPVGFCGLARTDLDRTCPTAPVEIGWRLALRHWGKGYVTDAARRFSITDSARGSLGRSLPSPFRPTRAPPPS